jgi:uncharacterized protein YegP (UPF0339 family)
MAGVFELKPAAGGQFMFNLKAGNGEIILTSERYREKDGAKNGIGSVKANATPDARYDRLTSKTGQHYFVLRAANGEAIGTSEMYSSSSAIEKGIAAVKSDGPSAPVKDLT